MTGSAESPVASRRVAEAIAERILTGALRPGTRIRQEELAAELGASRVPVREALRILDARGLVVLRSNTGAWVASMTEHDLVVSYMTRERIEPLLLRDSLLHLTDADLAHASELQERIEETDDVEEFLVLDRALHWTTYRGNRAPQLAGMVARLWDTTQHYRREYSRLAGSSRSWIINSEHRLLLEAIGRRDSETAEAVLAQHIGRTRLELRSHPKLFAQPDA